jgi:hypothetical protein
MRDRRQAWILDSDGAYTRLQPEGPAEGPETTGTHETLMRLARQRSID